jgi:putative effector of murein hydrolase
MAVLSVAIVSIATVSVAVVSIAVSFYTQWKTVTSNWKPAGGDTALSMSMPTM